MPMPRTSEPIVHGFTGRMLPPSEWAEKLVGTALDGKPLNPEHSGVAVVEDADGIVVACWSVMTIVHVEGLWEAESHRGHDGVSRLLISTMVNELRRCEVKEVLTQSLSEEVDTLIVKAGGQKVPGQTWVIPVKAL